MNLFFLIGPPRSGSSLMSRCIDDHPQALCLCESEANRGLFSPFALKLHMNRMRLHGGKGKKGTLYLFGKAECPLLRFSESHGVAVDTTTAPDRAKTAWPK
jgi:hypothetical protein